MEQRKLTDPLLKMTPVVILRRLPTGVNGTTSWRRIATERQPAQSSCTGVPMSLPFYRRRLQSSAAAPQLHEEHMNVTEKPQRITRRTKRRSHSLPTKKLRKKYDITTATTQGSRSDTGTCGNAQNSNNEESSLCDTVLEENYNFENTDSEETSSTYEWSASSVVSSEPMGQSAWTPVTSSDTEIDDNATYATSLSHDSSDTITVAVPGELLTDVDTDTDVESKTTSVCEDVSQCALQESSQGTVVIDCEKQGVAVEGQCSRAADIEEKRAVPDEEGTQTSSIAGGSSAGADNECVHKESECVGDTITKHSDICVTLASLESASTAPRTASREQISAQDEIDAFTADIIETMLDVHVNSLPTFVEEYFNHLKACLEVLISMQDADKDMYSRLLRWKRDSLRRIFQLLKQLRGIVDYSSLDGILMLERQYSNFLSLVGACATGKQAHVNDSPPVFTTVDVQGSGAVSDSHQAKSTECQAAVPSSATCSTSAQPQCITSPLANASRYNQSSFPPCSSPYLEASRQTVVPSSSPVANLRATQNTHGVQSIVQPMNVRFPKQRQQAQPTSTVVVTPDATLPTNSTSQAAPCQMQTSSFPASAGQLPSTLVVRGINYLSKSAQKHALRHCANMSNASPPSLRPLKPTTLPQHSSPAVAPNTCVTPNSSQTSNMLCQARSALNYGSAPSSTFAPVSIATLQQQQASLQQQQASLARLQTQPTPLQVHTLGVQPQLPVAVNSVPPVAPSVTWMPQRLWLVSSQRPTTAMTTNQLTTSCSMQTSASNSPVHQAQSYTRNSYPRPNVSNFALVLPPLSNVNQPLRSSMINVQAPVTAVQSGGGPTELQNRAVAVGGLNSLPAMPFLNQPRPCITGVVIPVVRSKQDRNTSQNSVVCAIQDAGGNVVPPGNGQNEKKTYVHSPTVPHLTMGSLK